MNTFFKDSLIILSLSFFLTGIVLFYQLDQKLAIYLYSPSNEFAWFLRQYSQIPGTVITLCLLVYLLIPALRDKSVILRKNALVWLLTLILGGGLLVHVFFKEIADRPRPRETTLLGGDLSYSEPFTPSSAEIKGKSFPSGHVAMASAFIIPFFVLRRRNTKTAYTFLFVGIFYAVMVSWARIVLGAHFLTDCLWAITLISISASASSTVIKESTTIKTRYISAFIACIIFCVIWWNKFTLNLSYTAPKSIEIHKLDLPCDITKVIMNDTPHTFILNTRVTGYGAPLSWLTLSAENETVYLNRYRGLFRNLRCTATLDIGEKHPVLQKLTKFK